MGIGKILIAEVESIIALDIKTTLVSNSYNVVGTARTFNGIEKRIKEHSPDLLITSHTLKNTDNYFSKIIELQKENNFFVLCLSAAADLTDLKSKCNEEYFTFLKKPFDSESMLKAIQSIELTKNKLST